MPPPIGRFLSAKLGTGSPSQLLARMFRQSFGSETFAAFWRNWNPIYGYFLTYYVFAPLSRVFSRPVSLMLTFLVSGFALHDLVLWPTALLSTGRPPFPVVTVAFAAIGVVVLLSERSGLTLAALSPPARAIVHTGVILSAFALSVSAAVIAAK